MLDVHSDCDEKSKQHGDGALDVLQSIVTKPAALWPSPGVIRRLALRPTKAPDEEGRPAPALGGARRCIGGAWGWIRGIHAALDGVLLEPTATGMVLPPVPVHDAEQPVSVAEMGEFSSLVRRVVLIATTLNKWDGFDCWGGEVRYRSTWFPVSDATPGCEWACYWTLTCDKAIAWSKTVMPPGAEFAWHGVYRLSCSPRGASLLTEEDIDEYMRCFTPRTP